MSNLQTAKFEKKKYIGLGFLVVVVLLVIAPMILASQKTAFSEKDFPLQIDLPKTVYNVGEKISLTAAIINRSGKDVNMTSNGAMPCVFFHNINDTTVHGEISMIAYQILKANDKVSRVFEYEAIEPGTYILDVHYCIGVNGVLIETKNNEITIEVR
jgi:hypothetical protein